MTKRNMKIEINESQPLDEVVMELEKRGYKKSMFTPNKNTHFIVVYESGSFTDLGKFDGGAYDWKLTTIAELKEMK